MTISARRIGIYLAIAAALVVLAAWIDGGEEPLRDISQSVAVPEGAL
ncbi:MAG: hypothetical protein H6920_11525 [Sphingomonadaceae bacterium]|nr:hypothetical protein [Sphingomonadaceae bacterium]MCB2086626.1 hypothetical protein [Sphingomonadaceae bacterium]MCC0011763.1 hypothetical protein [Rhodobiaceae bacterium]MCP5384585.1 hypothetical protein [Altererythrobacter sp.]MCP5392237.1 hypothetical protein [Sphingomonadaceae bacterium]